MRIGTRLFRRIGQGIVAAAMVAAASTLATIGFAAPAQALGAGEVCMFNAPSGAQLPLGLNAGHVGWGYLIGGSTTWTYGATESASYHWHTSGSWSAMLAAFRNAGYGHSAGYYTKYKCQNTGTSAVSAANTAVANGEATTYDWFSSNCLTRSIDIFNAYYGFGLYSGSGVAPNYYFDNLSWSGPYTL